MGHPKADPAGLAARWMGPLRGRGVLVVDVPDVAAAERLDPARSDGFRWFTTHWPVHAALLEAGYTPRFGPWMADAEGAGVALVFLPRGRERIRMTLAMVAAALPEGAPLWVVGAKGEGIESAAGDLDRVAVSAGVQTGRHARLLMANARAPAATRLEDHVVEWPLPSIDSAATAGSPEGEVEGNGSHPGPGSLRVVSLPGVFSHGRLDDGTRLLLDHVPDLRGPLLDVGCGAGVLGAWYASRGTAPVTLVDADALAVESARRTLTANGLVGAVEAGDVFPGEDAGAFASIVSNPPFHRGSATDDRVTATLVAGAAARLIPGGTLTLVCNRFLPVPDRLDRAFGAHRVLADDGRYRVYQARTPDR